MRHTLGAAAFLATALILALGDSALVRAADSNADRIRPYSKNVRYWQYQGEPVLLLGGSKDDSLFEEPDLEEHLDLLASVGGNYIRNTMSDRFTGYEVPAFGKLNSGKFDLNTWDEEYWTRFENLLRWTHERDIIVQIEVFDRFDYTSNKGSTHWRIQPFNPANNVNYTHEESGLALVYADHPARDKHPFFHTVPGMKQYKKRYDIIRKYQEAFVAKILSYSLEYPNVLYCMNNETATDPRWGRFWMTFIKKAAKAKGVDVCVSDMFDDGWKPQQSAKFRQAFDDPKAYDFIDMSQVNSRTFGEDHWKNLVWGLDQLKKHPRPLNHTKIYGSGFYNFGTGSPADGVERFWRNILAGSAGARFHRPDAGNGLLPIAQASIRAMRKLESEIKLWDVEPRNDLLGDREEDEAYLAAKPGVAYALYFTDGGSVKLDLRDAKGTFRLKWINIATGEWAGEEKVQGGRQAKISAPGKVGWAAVIVAE